METREVRVYPRNRTPGVVVAMTVIVLIAVGGLVLGAGLTIWLVAETFRDPAVLLSDIGRARSIPGWMGLIAGPLLFLGCGEILRKNTGFLKELYVGRVETRRVRKRR